MPICGKFGAASAAGWGGGVRCETDCTHVNSSVRPPQLTQTNSTLVSTALAICGQPPSLTLDPFNWLVGQAVEGKQNTVSLLLHATTTTTRTDTTDGPSSRTVDHKNHHAQVKPPTTISYRAATVRTAARAAGTLGQRAFGLTASHPSA